MKFATKTSEMPYTIEVEESDYQKLQRLIGERKMSKEQIIHEALSIMENTNPHKRGVSTPSKYGKLPRFSPISLKKGEITGADIVTQMREERQDQIH